MPIRDLEAVANLPPRQLAPMRAQPLVPWTPLRLLTAGWVWLIAETERVPEALPARETMPRQ
ncbi:MAG: hypothetical protein ACREFW_03350 [Rhizomicrobium sp.]